MDVLETLRQWLMNLASPLALLEMGILVAAVVLSLFIGRLIATHFRRELVIHEAPQHTRRWGEAAMVVLPWALTVVVVQVTTIALRDLILGQWMSIGLTVLWSVLVYLSGAQLLRLALPLSSAKYYERILLLPFVLLIAVLYAVGWLPHIAAVIHKPLLTVSGAQLSIASMVKGGVAAWVFVWLAGCLSVRAQTFMLERYEIDEHTSYLAAQGIKIALWFVGGFIVLDVLGINLSTLKFFAGALGLGIGFGMQQLANNLISGALLLVERSVNVGDVVNVAGQTGRVERISLRATIIRTSEDKQVIVPNMQLITTPLSRWAKDEPSCIQLAINTNAVDDLAQLERLFLDALTAHSRVLHEPPPKVRLTRVGADLLAFELLVWVDAIGDEALDVQSDLYRGLHNALRQNGITIK